MLRRLATSRTRELAATADDALQPFFAHEAKRFLQRDEHGHRRSRGRLRLLERRLVRREVEIGLRQVDFSYAFHARGLIVTIATPGGAPHAFCDAVTQTSMPHSSISSSVHPAPETLSTRKSLPESRTTAAMSFIGFRTPVEVSLWVMRTAFAASFPFSLASSSRTRSGSTARPYGTSTRRASTP